MAKPRLEFTKGRVVLHRADGTTEIRGTGMKIGPDEVRDLQDMLRALEPIHVEDEHASGTEQGD